MQVLPLGEKNSEQPLGQTMGPGQLLPGEKKEKKRNKKITENKNNNKKNDNKKSEHYVPLQRPI
jgi:ribosomal protein L21